MLKDTDRANVHLWNITALQSWGRIDFMLFSFSFRNRRDGTKNMAGAGGTKREAIMNLVFWWMEGRQKNLRQQGGYFLSLLIYILLHYSFVSRLIKKADEKEPPGPYITGTSLWLCSCQEVKHISSWCHGGVRQGCPLSQILLMIFMDNMSRSGWGEESVYVGNLRIACLLHTTLFCWLVERFRAECEAVWMRVCTFKSKAVVICQITVECFPLGW